MSKETLSKPELISTIAEKHDLPKKTIAAIVNDVFDTIVETTVAGKKVQLIGFGSFEVRERAARKGRNPQTGEELEIAASKTPAFKAGKSFKNAVK